MEETHIVPSDGKLGGSRVGLSAFEASRYSPCDRYYCGSALAVVVAVLGAFPMAMVVTLYHSPAGCA